MAFHDVDQRFWARHLMPRERLFWDGRPGWVFDLDLTALWLCLPFGAAALAMVFEIGPFQAFMETEDFVTGSAALEQQVKLALIAGTLWCAGFVLARSLPAVPWLHRYAVTDRRVLIRSALPWRGLYAKRLTPMSPVAWDGQNPGTITFDEKVVTYGTDTTATIAPRKVWRLRRVGFFNIPEADRVEALIRRVMEGKA